MVEILDVNGRPWKKQELKEEIAGPSLTGVRQHFTDHVTHGLTPQRLAMILRAAEVGDPHEYLGMAEELEEKDLHYQAIMGTRKRAVSQLELTVEPASDSTVDEANAQLVRDALEKDDIEDMLFDILDAVGKGFSVSEIIWDTSEKQWLPQEIIWRDPRWFEFDRIDHRTLMLRNGSEPIPLAPYKFIYHTHKAKSGLPIRGGVARSVAWAWMFKNFGVKDWVVFAEVYGQPIRVGKYGPNANRTEKATLLRAVSQIGTDAAAIIPESMMIEFIKADSTGSSDLYEKLCNWMDYQMSKAVLGQTTTTDAVSGGHAVSKEHNEVREDIERADSKQLCATLNRFLVKPVVDLNQGPQKKYPKIRLGRGEYTNIPELASALNLLVPLGLRVGMNEVRSKIGLKEPGKDEEILALTAADVKTDDEEPTVMPDADKKSAQSAKAATLPDEPARDDIDDFVDLNIDELQREVGDGVVQIILDVAARSVDFDDFVENMLDAIPGIKLDGMADLLARSSFNARLDGVTVE
ncbi:DUF935 domain-containing protein [Paremcibacter congregatus]|uniref:DUF935 domain-containing protein n=1 Tax=Paremcibacter congregatus TaxID=2043170 RepID=UPI0030ED6CB5|tara:strand:+ start:2151 stop:3716 length:1566 start_codon:yes stop_codon:yes gene_type:complete